MKEKIGMLIACIGLIVFFLFFFMSVKPQEPQRVYVPAHYEIVYDKMHD